MGLDTSHNCWHGPYGSFNKFRESLANQIGITLNDYKGYHNKSATKDLSSIDHEIMPLLNHSDCDGELTVEECNLIVVGLNKILDNLKYSSFSIHIFKEQIIQFRDGCLLAIENNEPVYFH